MFHFQKYYGAIDLAKDKDITASEINNGQPLSFRIDFPIQNPLPKLMSVNLNGQQLCSSPRDSDVLTNLMLEYTYSTGLPDNYNSQQPSLQQGQSTSQFTQPAQVQYVQQTTRVTQRYTPNTTPKVFPTHAPSQNYNVGNQCGIPEYNAPTTTGLIHGGRFATRGQFPW